MEMNRFKEVFNKHIFIAIIIIGIILRTIVYLNNQSFWFDEGALAMNIYEKNYLELFNGLNYLQVAPPLFLVITKFFTNLFNLPAGAANDLVLRFLPFISSILALPLFYKFLNIISKDKFFKALSLFFLAITPCAVMYATQFKQYSTEMLITIILMIIFYKIIFLKEYKWWYSLAIAISPWISYSSFFILTTGILLLLKNKRFQEKNITLTTIILLFSIGLLYFCNIKSVICSNYFGMKYFWQNNYGFAVLIHPIRLLHRLGECFVNFNKGLTVIFGVIFLIPTFKYVFSQEKINKKIFYLLPFLLVCIASTLNKYPLYNRLILFLFPYFAYLISYYYKTKLKYIYILFILCFIVFSKTYTGYFFENNFQTRELAQYLEKELKPDDIIVKDVLSQKYRYYLKDKNLQNKQILIPYECVYEQETCSKYMSNLPKGNYYILIDFFNLKNLFKGNNAKIEDIKIEYSNNIKPIYVKIQ